MLKREWAKLLKAGFAAGLVLSCTPALYAQGHRPADPPVVVAPAAPAVVGQQAEPAAQPVVQTETPAEAVKETPAAQTTPAPASTWRRPAAQTRTVSNPAPQQQTAPAVEETQAEPDISEAEVSTQEQTASVEEDDPLAAAVTAESGRSIAFGLAGLKETAATAGSILLVLGKLLLVVVLAYLSVVGLKFFYMRSGKPLKFGTRLLQVEESAPLGAGAAVHLVRIENHRWLVGTAQGQVNILAVIDEDGEMQQPVLESSQDSEKEGEGTQSAHPDFQGLELTHIFSKVKPRSESKKRKTLAGSVATDLRQTSSFIDEIRSRLGDSQRN